MFEIAGIQSAFTVRSPVIVGTGSTGISFQFTTTNVGGNFDNATGVFTCEHPGVYVFHLHISTNLNQDQAYCSIRLNGYSDLVRAHSTISSSDTGGGGYIGSSNTLTVHLNAGDTIDVGYCTEIESFYTAKSTTFSGYLLVPDP